jgi:cysteine desulfurase / selenocysteine lyase
VSARPIYLDNASTSWPKPPGVAAAMLEHLEAGSATPARGAYAMAVKSSRAIAALRLRLARLIGAPDPDYIVLTTGATESLNMAIFGLFEAPSSTVMPKVQTDAPPRVVTTQLEHNAVTRPLAALKRKGWIDLVVVPADADGFIDAAALLAAINENTALVALTHASNVLGTIQPVARLGELVKDRAPGALTLVDASQSIGLVPIDVHSDAIDLLAFSGHKTLLGPPGTGVLYVSDRAMGQADALPLCTLRPTRMGGTGDDSSSDTMPETRPGRFEPGTPNTVGFVGLLAAIDAQDKARDETDAPGALAHERCHCARLIEHLHKLSGTHILGTTDVNRRVGVVAFTLDAMDPAACAAVLDASFGICVRAGLHCAPGAHAWAGTLERGGAIRVSPGPFTTDADIDALLAALDQFV